MLSGLLDFFQTTGFALITWKMVIMWAVVVVLLWLAIAKGFEPLLLIPIAFGALIANIPTRGVITAGMRPDGVYETATFKIEGEILPNTTHGNAPAVPAAPGAPHTPAPVRQTLKVDRIEGGLFDFISQGIKLELFPPLIFLGVGALTDFGPLIALPRTLLLGAAAQFGLFVTFMGAGLMGFTSKQAASIGIIGGADGPTAIFLTNKLAPELLGAVAVAAYSYMSLVPLIQPPIMRLLTTDKERRIRMKSLRPVSKLEKLIFAVLTMMICILLVPDAAALIAMLMLGNFLRECAVTERLVKASQNEIINILTIFLGTSVGITMAAESFLAPSTLKIIVLGVVAFGCSTAAGVLAAKLMNVLSPNTPINPLIGSAGVSAVPMAARVSHVEGQKYDKGNYLLMPAMGPNVAGVIGTAVAAGYFLSTLSH
jgi:sodium ion-translocating decarboxylase beta subunit